MAKQSSISVHIYEAIGEALSLLIFNDEIYIQEVLAIPKNGKMESSFILWWLISRSKKLFEALPMTRIDIKVSRLCLDKYVATINSYLTIIGNTNAYHKSSTFENIKSLKKDNILIFEVKNQRYESLTKIIKSHFKGRVRVLHEPFNFNPKLRVYEEKELKFTIDKLMTFILIEKINKVCIVNMDPLIRYMQKEEINIFSILENAGCKILYIQNDPSELDIRSYLIRDMIGSKSIEFINMGILSKHHNKLVDQQIVYSPIMQDYSLNAYWPIGTSNERKVIVLSNSRFYSTFPHFHQIKKLTDSFEKPFEELPIWYLSICKILDNEKDMGLYDKLNKRHELHWLFYNCAQYMKFNIINELEKEVNIDVYGDVGWMEVCPKSYCGYIEQEEFNEMYTSSKILFLLLNFGFTYLDHSGPVYDMIKNGSNWINVPSVCTTKELEGLKNLEYKNISHLIQIIDQYKEQREKSKFSLNHLREIYQSSTDTLLNLLDNNVPDTEESLFESSYKEHNLLLDNITNGYIVKHHESLLKEIFN